MTPRGYAWIENVRHPSRCAWARRLLLEDFLDLAEFLLELTADFFDLAFGFEAGFVQDAPDFLFDSALHFVERAAGFVAGASVHVLPRFARSIFVLRRPQSPAKCVGKSSSSRTQVSKCAAQFCREWLSDRRLADRNPVNARSR